MNNFADTADGARQILDRLEQAYDYASRPELVKVVQEWRKLVE